MKLHEVFDDDGDYDYPPSPEIKVFLVGPHGPDAETEVPLRIDVSVETTEREGPHVFSQGGFEVVDAAVIGNHRFMGHVLQNGSSFPLKLVPYIDFSDDDIDAMGSDPPTPGDSEDDIQDLFTKFIEHRIAGQVDIPERRYPISR